ncbi:MAG TPA: helix-turn-helix transcriptional regulator [Roseiarcus sp.]|nr:helix-turn-helix transcriptional regulator [Roseiarcus sp.]
MSITIEEVRRLLAHAPSKDTAEALKEWRAQLAYSQAEAAIRLGVPLRTLQGWELGRPMPYPALLQRAVPTIAHPMNRYALSQAEFPREFAEFIDFVGAAPLDKETRKIELRLHALRPTVRAIYGDRYFFQEECLRFTYDVPAFGLDIANPQAVRAAALIAGINRVRRSLSAKATDRFRAMVIDNLGRDMRQLEHEICSWTHFARKGFNVIFADLEGVGRFDLLVETPAGSVAVECKTIGEDTGDQIKTELAVSLAKIFDRATAILAANTESGQFTLTLKKAADQCKNLPQKFEAALKAGVNDPRETEDFSLTFAPKPDWQGLLSADGAGELERQMQLATEADRSERFTIGVITPHKVFGLAIRSHAPTRFRRNLVQILKGAAGQCPNSTPSAVWLHFVGVAEADFRDLCDFSIKGGGAGLNGVVADVLHPEASRTDRSHVQRILFSVQSRVLHRHPMLDANLIVIRTVSHSTTCFDVPNPKCKFVPLVEI